MDRRKAYKIAAALADGKPAAVALRSVGYSPATARAPSNVTAHPMVVEARQELRDAILRRAPDYYDKLAAVAVDGLAADKKTYASFEGVITDERSDPDHQARHRFLEMGARIFGFLRDKDAGTQVNVFNPSQFFLMMRQAEGERGLDAVEG